MAVSTFYPADSDNDASMRATQSTSQSWATVRNHAGDAIVNGTLLIVFVAYATEGASNPGWDRLYRSIMIFDTSSLPDGDDINSAYVGAWWDETEASNGLQGAATGWSAAQKCIVMTAGTTASDTAVVTGDYDAVKGAADWSAHFDATKDTDADPSASGGWSDAGYVEHDLNATGISGISKSGVTKIAIQCVADVDNDEPSVSSGTNAGVLMQARSFDYSGTSSDIKLVVNHGVDFIPRVIMF